MASNQQSQRGLSPRPPVDTGRQRAVTETGKRRKTSAALGLPEGVQVFEHSPACTSAAQRNLLLQVWREPPSSSTFERLDAHYQAMIAQQPLCVSLVVLGDMPAPDGPTRDAIAQLLRKYERNLIGLGFVLDGSSAKRSLIRFSLTTIALLSGTATPQPVFDSVEAASRWLADVLPAPSAQDVASVINRIRHLP